jgi:hypothetical protein
MAGLDWKSDSAATVIHPFLKGNGRIHLNGTGGVKFQKPGSNLDPGFSLQRSKRNVIPSEAQRSRGISDQFSSRTSR